MDAARAARISALAQRLRAARSGREIHRLRSQMDDATAKEVIRHPSISPLERVAILLAKNFSGTTRWGHGDSMIYPDIEDDVD